jgi:hypothetical protein
MAAASSKIREGPPASMPHTRHGACMSIADVLQPIREDKLDCTVTRESYPTCMFLEMVNRRRAAGNPRRQA